MRLDRARKHGLSRMNTIEKVPILHPRSPSVSFLVLYHRTTVYHRGEVFRCPTSLQSSHGTISYPVTGSPMRRRTDRAWPHRPFTSLPGRRVLHLIYIKEKP